MNDCLVHPFAPLYNAESKILILGSFPSVASRAQQFYYGHPRNRFWPLLASLLEADVPHSIEEKKQLLLERHIALYDAVSSCSITHSDDARMRKVVPADISGIVNGSGVTAIFANGNKAYEICTKKIGVEALKLPSTSPANARFRLADLKAAWKVILAYL